MNQATTFEREPTAPIYNALGQVLTHTDGKGQTTRLLRTARGLPSSRQDAKGQRIRYEYDKAIRLTALVNENNAAYQFAYDASDRLIEEKRIDNLTRRFSYNIGGHLTRVDEIGYGDKAERPQRHAKLHDIFGADAALYITISEYGTQYMLISSDTSVTASAKLVDLRTGTTLWTGSARASSEEGNNGGGLVGMLITAAVKQVINSSTDAAHPIAGITSARLLSAGQRTGILYGPRNPKYGTD